uniref:Polygalacturonase n=1 Tax=Mangifera indica TaxID=29780 RepID=A0A514YDD5_MANIN|nr:polygalacturonase [Mangifera indica]
MTALLSTPAPPLSTLREWPVDQIKINNDGLASSVGSLGEHGADDTVEQVHVRECNFTGAKNGARIKTFRGGSGYARDISCTGM